MILKENTYFCHIVGSCQHSYKLDSLKSFSSFSHSGSSGMVFFIPGSSQILPMPITEKRQNSNLPFFQYVSQTSVCSDSTVSTYDLQVRINLADNASKGYAGKKRFGVRKVNLN